ncbi:MAG: flagellar hook-basal body complex protein FliE [Bdellovibrionales bacterium CG10_big_fil_rev_8_21_14_0_10_45_34]|nr:MAG: flagellar hook-basal body complex protein FliE [Bdellovibrionales bacterium CG10_big_fil_rev_8_21_14_0_10_45_34]
MDGLKIGLPSTVRLPGIEGKSIGSSQDSTAFASTLKDAITSVNSLQKNADLSAQKLVAGDRQSLHETMVAMEKADIALRLMVQVRNKLIDAYQEIMRMQV